MDQGLMDTDEMVMRRSLGEPEAFALLVDRHGAAIHQFLTRRVGQLADDLLSEVWLVAFSRRHSFDPGLGVVRGWLFGIARTVLMAHWRLRQPVASSFPELVDDGGWDRVDERLDAAAVRPSLRAALRLLPEVERELLLLVAWEHLSPTEAAQVVGIPSGTARSRLHRARGRLRAMVDGAALSAAEATTSSRYLTHGEAI